MEWYHYVIIGAGAVILVMLIISMFGGKKKPKSIEPTKTAQPVQAEPKVAKVETPKKVEEPMVEEKPKASEMPKVVKTETKPVEVKKEVEESDKTAKYHVSQNKDEKSPNFKKWRVRKEGSNKTIKFFDTQKEAIDYADDLAQTAGSSVVIHKVDGSIRKQDYTKKA